MSTIKIIAFGIIAEKLQAKELVLENISDTNSLLEHLKKTYPTLNGIKISVAVNKNIITQNTIINQESEVALLPPFSGG